MVDVRVRDWLCLEHASRWPITVKTEHVAKIVAQMSRGTTDTEACMDRSLLMTRTRLAPPQGTARHAISSKEFFSTVQLISCHELPLPDALWVIRNVHSVPPLSIAARLSPSINSGRRTGDNKTAIGTSGRYTFQEQLGYLSFREQGPEPA